MLYNLSEEESTNKESIKKLFLSEISEEGFSRESNEEPLKQNRD